MYLKKIRIVGQAAYMENRMTDFNNQDRLLLVRIIEQLVDRFRQFEDTFALPGSIPDLVF